MSRNLAPAPPLGSLAPDVPAAGSPPGRLLRVAGAAVAVALVALALRDADLSAAASRIGALGPSALLVLVPFGVALCFDSLSFRIILGSIGARASFAALWTVRVATEGLVVSAPAGPLVAEAVKPYLLRDRAGVPVAASVGAIGGRRVVIIASHACMVALGALTGGAFLARTSPAVLGVEGLREVTWIGAGALALVSFSLAQLLARGEVASRLLELLSRVPLRRVASAALRGAQAFRETDASVIRFLSDRRAVALAVGAHLGSWLLEAVETFLILRLLGVPIGPFEALAIEALLAVLRSAVFFVPAGLGFQEVGYLAFLRAAGIADPATAGAAFVALKRLREIGWLSVGFLVLGSITRRRGAAATAT